MRTQINVHDRRAHPPPRNCGVFGRGHVIFSRPGHRWVNWIERSNRDIRPNIALNLMDHHRLLLRCDLQIFPNVEPFLPKNCVCCVTSIDMPFCSRYWLSICVKKIAIRVVEYRCERFIRLDVDHDSPVFDGHFYPFDLSRLFDGIGGWQKDPDGEILYI